MAFSGVIDLQEIIRRIVKYIAIGVIVAIAAYAIPRRSLNLEEIALLALSAAATFAILDAYLPAMGVAARAGTGLGIGAMLALSG